MMKKVVIVLSAIAALSLTGCADDINARKAVVDEYVGEAMLHAAGVTQDPEYVHYIENRDAGNLDTEGYYADPEDELSEEQGQITVSLARNNNLNTRYYSDESCSAASAISASTYYLNPGDQLYVTVETDRDVYTSEYEFSEFRIDECDDDGNRVESNTLQMEESDGKYVLSIPSDYEGTDISIVPLGEFSLKTIKANAYCTDDNGTQPSVSGTWEVNGNKFSGTTEISCTAAYTVTFQYDSNEYFFVSSEPQCFYSDNEEGVVNFERYEANSKITDFSVELHRNMTIPISSAVNRRVTVDGVEEETSVAPGKPLQLESKKYGDVVTLETDQEWPELSAIQELSVTSEEHLSNGGYKYSLRVHAKDGDFVFDPSDYQYEHGTVNFYLNGNLITDTEYLAPNTIITFEQGSADQGYWLKGSNRSITISNNEDTIDALKAIEFVPQDPVTVRLPQPSAGGTITYTDPESEKTIKTAEVSTYQGAEIDMSIHAWDGWTSDVVEYTYTVTGDKTQTIKINGKDVDDAFVESEDHKIKLTVTLDKSVGDTMDFAISASGYDESGFKYSSKPFASNSRTETIGTDQSILISVYHRTNQAGRAVRAEIKRTATDKATTTETIFLDDSRNAFDPIDIYEDGTNDAPETTYTAINVTISVADVTAFSQAVPKEYTTVSVTRKDSGEALSVDDFVSSSENVTVTVSPDSEHYLTAERNITGDAYVESMKYSEYVDRIDSILEGIQVHEYIHVTLDESDSYATYRYQLGRDTVSGLIRAKEGQKLELTYTISDDTYELSEAHGGFIFGLGSSTSKATESIDITKDMDGTVINKESFGIETKRKD